MNYRNRLITVYKKRKDRYIKRKDSCYKLSQIINQQLRKQFCDEDSQLVVKQPKSPDGQGYFKFQCNIIFTENFDINFTYSIKVEKDKFAVKILPFVKSKTISFERKSPYSNRNDEQYYMDSLQEGMEFLFNKFEEHVKNRTAQIVDSN